MGAKPDTKATIDALEAAIDALKAAENDLPDATESALRHTQLRSPHPKRIRGIAAVGVFTLILEAFIMIVLTAASFLGGEPFELSAVGGETFLVLPRSSMSMIALLSLLLAIMISVAIERTIVKPMRSMTWHMGKLAKGDFSIRMPPNDRIEINEAKQFTKSFNKAAEELSGIEIMRANFISDFSHEFRTPIASISGFAQLLRDQNLSPEERDEYLDIIIDESKRLSNLSEDILNLSRMESSSILTNISAVDVAEGLRRSIAKRRREEHRHRRRHRRSGTDWKRRLPQSALDEHPAKRRQVHAGKRPHRRIAQNRAGRKEPRSDLHYL